MNRINILLVLVAVAGGVATANKLHRGGLHNFEGHSGHGLRHSPHHLDNDDFEEFEHRHPHIGRNPHRHGHLGHIEDAILFEELKSRGHLLEGLHGGHAGHGLKGLVRKGRHGKRHGKHGLGAGLGAGVGAGAGGIGAIGAAGGLGAGLKKSNSHFGEVDSNTHAGAHGSAEASKGSIIGGKKHFDAEHHDLDHSDKSGAHKHQVINNEKTIIKDRTTGVNDEDSFRDVDTHSNGGHISTGTSGLAASGAAGRIEGGKEFDNDFHAAGGSKSDTLAGVGAAGGVGAVGAAAAAAAAGAGAGAGGFSETD